MEWQDRWLFYSLIIAFSEWKIHIYTVTFLMLMFSKHYTSTHSKRVIQMTHKHTGLSRSFVEVWSLSLCVWKIKVIAQNKSNTYRLLQNRDKKQSRKKASRRRIYPAPKSWFLLSDMFSVSTHLHIVNYTVKCGGIASF